MLSATPVFFHGLETMKYGKPYTNSSYCDNKSISNEALFTLAVHACKAQLEKKTMTETIKQTNQGINEFDFLFCIEAVHVMNQITFVA